ncbi:DUF6212 domain-containing protein [Roseomonas sp. AR75]|uniref:DUF6212 domain-containing protein n=1 Tax=Roseomonas sp. AR75 TaxID=2562311 RepID=UPI0010C06F07|nr:DUF6212 domain-containing protein [Roseomonas sp. AR75]
MRIGTAELAEIEAGAPALVAAPGIALPPLHPLLVLTPRDGVLTRADCPPDRSVALPPDLPLLALLAPELAAAELLPLLPEGLPVLDDPAMLPALLAEVLQAAQAGRDAAEAEARLLRRALGSATPRPALALDLPPIGGAAVAAPASQPLGRPATGLCTLELHLAAPGRGTLHLRLVAGERVVGSWRVPEAARPSGWLALDLPEPAPELADEALLEVVADGAEVPPLLSLCSGEPQAGLALRLWTAGPGWSVLPRHFDWAALGAARPILPLPFPAPLLAEAVPTGGRAELVALGEDIPRLAIELPAEGTMTLDLPAVPVGPADLLRLALLRREPDGASVEVALGTGAATTGWRPLGMRTELALPLPAGGMVVPRLALRQSGARPVLLEIESLALLAGAAGEKRMAPAAEQEGGRRRHAVMVPPGPVLPAWQPAPPAPPPDAVASGRGGARAAVAATPFLPAGATGFQEFRLNQHLDKAGSTYRHMDVAIAGLVSPGGLWRQVRLKLFERRGVAGLEFRQARGWPPMFDSWPQGGKDPHGPFWRLETEATATALAALTTPHDRALIAALMDVLPEVAGRASRAARLDAPDTARWATLAGRVAEAVALAREAGRTA